MKALWIPSTTLSTLGPIDIFTRTLSSSKKFIVSLPINVTNANATFTAVHLPDLSNLTNNESSKFMEWYTVLDQPQSFEVDSGDGLSLSRCSLVSNSSEVLFLKTQKCF